jgi:hypothetical protein
MYDCAYNNVRYQWDRTKAASNLRKHGVYFADAISVFEDELAVTIEDDYAEERRWITLGRDFFGRILIVVYSWSDDEIRIISAKKANARERKQYEKKHEKKL